jgi:hypothetical protein
LWSVCHWQKSGEQLTVDEDGNLFVMPIWKESVGFLAIDKIVRLNVYTGVALQAYY